MPNGSSYYAPLTNHFRHLIKNVNVQTLAHIYICRKMAAESENKW